MAQTLLDLGMQPLANNLCRTAEEAMRAERFPLRAVVEDDLTIHLDYEVEPAKLYQHYLYRSGTSQPYIDHCAAMYQSFKHLKHNTIIDIGGNDGTLLKTFQGQSAEKLRLVNVDASESVQGSNEEAGIEFINTYWSEDVNVPKADIIVSTNVFQHTKDIHAFLRGIQKHLDGVWILEFPYALETILTGQFDQFYHEHYYYWLLSPLEELFKQYGLKIIHALPMDIHGGTMRLWMTNKEPSAPAFDLSCYMKFEQEAVAKGPAFFGSVFESVGDHFIHGLASGKWGKVCFFGAAAKGCVFLNALNLNIHTVGEMVVIDDTPEKQGLFVPGTGFQVVDRSVLPEYDTVVILAHNFREHIAKSLAEDWNGATITFLPIEL
ncbi:Methyltransferase domain containing protein [uncultured Caudovirales phage]|uniref:Methyltransferase domain containing protein n=1 Tax=uncultured Caudovirales phage TaxID=2100421 RepID=A0A6J7X2Z4_9CAUD|nr:Methyltransferase domain containing protein [uncultured Caudovirales phage]